MSSPDKREYSDVPGYSNTFHVKELYLEEFVTHLGQHFRNVAILGQRICYGSVIALDQADEAFSSFVKQDGAFTREGGIPRPIYSAAVAANDRLPVLTNQILSVIIQTSEEAQLCLILTGTETRDSRRSEQWRGAAFHRSIPRKFLDATGTIEFRVRVQAVAPRS